MEDQWCNIPKDLLELISKKIISVEDYLRLRAVCIPWRSALSPNPRHLPPQSPWLMLPYDPNQNEGNNEDSTRLFYDISSCKIRKIELPETCRKQYCGSSKGWLMLQEGPDISLMNPITKVQINLPSLESSPKILGVQNSQSLDDIMSRLDIWSSWLGCEDYTGSIVKRAILTSNPTLDPNCIVMAIFKNNWELAFCRIGDESWTILEPPNDNNRGHFHLTDAIFHNELFYCFSSDEVKIYNCDGSRREVLKIKIPLRNASYHLLEGTFNELMLMAQHWAPFGVISRRNLFSVYKLGIQDERPVWKEIEGIGEKTCFICDDIDQYFTLEGFEGNILYYAYHKIMEKVRKNHLGRYKDDKFGYDIKKVKLPWDQQVPISYYRKENVTKINVDLGPYPTTYSKALWFTPSLY